MGKPLDEYPESKPLFDDDDIKIPPPRVAHQWFCNECGEAGAKPEAGFLTVDPRYAIGFCDCTPGRRSKVSGYHRAKVHLIADFHWDRDEWLARQARKAEKAAYEKVQAGLPVKPEEAVAAARYRARIGMVAPIDG